MDKVIYIELFLPLRSLCAYGYVTEVNRFYLLVNRNFKKTHNPYLVEGFPSIEILMCWFKELL